MAGDEEGDGVAPDGLSYGLCGTAAYASSDVAIGGSGSIWNGQQLAPYGLLERGAVRLQWWQSGREAAGKISIQPATSGPKTFVAAVGTGGPDRQIVRRSVDKTQCCQCRPIAVQYERADRGVMY